MNLKAGVTSLLLTVTPKLSFAVGIGSQDWGDQAGVSDPILGILLVAACLGVLLFGWTLGKASLNLIYIPTFIGALILLLIFQKFTLKAFIGYLILGLPLGQVLRLIFGGFWLRGGKQKTTLEGVTELVSPSTKVAGHTKNMTSETSSTPLQLINERQRFDEELERAKVRRIINGPNSKERISLLVELTLNDHFSRQVGADSTRASIILNRQGDPRIVQHSGLGANDLVIIDLTEVAERIQFEIGLNGPKSLDDQIITLMKDVIIEEFNRQSLEFSLLPDRA